MIKWFKSYLFDPEFNRRKRFLQRVAFFKNVPRNEFGRLFQVLVARNYPEGELLFHEGEVGRALFILETGKVEIFRKDAAGQVQHLAILDPGDYFGEMSLLDDLPRTGSARALTNCRVYLLYKTEFDSLVLKAPSLAGAIMSHLAGLLAGRLRLMIDRSRAATSKDTGPFVGEVL